ncbi:hypothetical protein C7271_23240 [filamentous cyanobacterium CCP5]|nr:hypothetical protein C7271_23240 [filamentous cyanobacterium CCP5]
MNSNGFNQVRLNFPGLGCWITLIAGAWLLGAVGLGWIVKSVLVLIVLLTLAPIIGFLAFRWWLQRNLVQAKCPVCSFDLAGLNNTGSVCPNCGTALRAEEGQFRRTTPEGTIEVDVVEISAETLPEITDDNA